MGEIYKFCVNRKGGYAICIAALGGIYVPELSLISLDVQIRCSLFSDLSDLSDFNLAFPVN